MKRFAGWSVIFLLLAVCGVAAADSIEAVKARMAKRLPAIAEMKLARMVGEDNRGYLAILKDGADKALVDAENKDRKLVYQAVSEETGADLEAVGRQRAKQIAERSTPGIMLQDPQGRWKAKPSDASS